MTTGPDIFDLELARNNRERRRLLDLIEATAKYEVALGYLREYWALRIRAEAIKERRRHEPDGAA